MTDNELIQVLQSMVGQSITHIQYVQTEFDPANPGRFNWSAVHPDTFVLHAEEWRLTLSDGRVLHFSSALKRPDNFASRFVVNVLAKNPAATTLSVPETYSWKNILHTPITRFRLWKRVFKSVKLFGQSFDYKCEDGFQIIELYCGNKTLCISLMNGDIGAMTFYPTGYLGERPGVIIDKTVCESHTVYGLIMKLKVAYKSGA
jgi:hypothetical protein